MLFLCLTHAIEGLTSTTEWELSLESLASKQLIKFPSLREEMVSRPPHSKGDLFRVRGGHIIMVSRIRRGRRDTKGLFNYL